MTDTTEFCVDDGTGACVNCHHRKVWTDKTPLAMRPCDAFPIETRRPVGHATGHDISIATMPEPVEIVKHNPAGKLAVADRLGITDDYLLRKAQEVLNEALAGTPEYDDDGNLTSGFPNLTAANRALELLMKHRGMLAADVEHEIAIGLNVTINGIDPEQLR